MTPKGEMLDLHMHACKHTTPPLLLHMCTHRDGGAELVEQRLHYGGKCGVWIILRLSAGALSDCAQGINTDALQSLQLTDTDKHGAQSLYPRQAQILCPVLC